MGLICGAPSRNSQNRDGGSPVVTRHRSIREFGTGGGFSGEKGKLSGLDEVQGEIPGPPGSRNFGGQI